MTPGTPTPSVDESRSLIERKFFTAEELWDMRDNPGMKIPEWPSKGPCPPTFTNRRGYDQDRTGVFQGRDSVPNSSDYTANPADRKIEVLIYNSRSRIIWVLSREWVAFNGP